MGDFNVMRDFDSVGQAFAKEFYKEYDVNRLNVLKFFHPEAIVTYAPDTRAQGHEQIKVILTDNLKFTTIAHILSSVDCQPTMDGSIIVCVTGLLKIDEEHPHGFSEVFLLKSFETGIFIANDIFRLALHDVPLS